MRKILYVECGKHKFNVSDPGVESIGSTDAPRLMFFIQHKDTTTHTLIPSDSDTVLIKFSGELPDIVVPEPIIAKAS